MTSYGDRLHWQRVYAEKTPESVSWYQPMPSMSLGLIEAAAGRGEPVETARIVDIGGGASTLVDCLLRMPCAEICVVDIAARAMEHARERLKAEGIDASRVRWVEADATGPLSEIGDAWADVWHDRAVFHFLTAPDARLAYARNFARVLKPGGTAVIAAFAPDGPERCSGLPVCRHDAATIAVECSRAGRAFTVIGEHREEHATPWGSVQRFIYAVLKG